MTSRSAWMHCTRSPTSSHVQPRGQKAPTGLIRLTTSRSVTERRPDTTDGQLPESSHRKLSWSTKLQVVSLGRCIFLVFGGTCLSTDLKISLLLLCPPHLADISLVPVIGDVKGGAFRSLELPQGRVNTDSAYCMFEVILTLSKKKMNKQLCLAKQRQKLWLFFLYVSSLFGCPSKLKRKQKCSASCIRSV